MEITTTPGAPKKGPKTDVPPGRRRRHDVIHWIDRVYGPTEVTDPGLIALITCPTVQRLKGVRQAGPSALAFPFKTVTRFEHSLGVFELLRRLGADRKEQVAGLLHDVSHTAFSHAIDFVHATDEQAHHEEIKHVFLARSDLAEAIRALGFSTDDFLDDSAYPLLERPIPWLCADRIDYFLRDGLACGVCSKSDARRFLEALAVVDQVIVFRDVETAQEACRLFAIMNRDWWASPTEAYIYNEFGNLLRRAVDENVIMWDDLLSTDDAVWLKLRQGGSPEIQEALNRVEHFEPRLLEGYRAVIAPKKRWLDPPVVSNGKAIPLSRL
jgi:uncharacterized protein